MKTENTPENRKRFEAVYYGIKKVASPKYRYIKILPLRSISSLADGEAKNIAKIMSADYSNKNEGSFFDLSGLIDYLENIINGYHNHGHYSISLISLADYLRSIGILIPWMYLSVEDIKAYGWAKDVQP